MPERDAVLHAARDGKIEVVRESLDADPSLMAARDENGGGPLHMAAMRGHADIAALLLERGVERDAGNDWGWTPIVYAAYNGRADVARVLIEADVDVTSSGGNPIHYAAQGKHVDICRMLVEAGAVDATVDAGDPDVLATFRAAYAYDADALAALLAADPKLATTRDKDGRTPMHEASTGGAIDVIRAFIDAGADVTATDDDGETPLDRAAAHGHGDVVRLLVDAGAAADIFVAVKFSMLPEARAALEADPSQANAEFHGHAIVEHAAEAGLVEMGALLAEFGADIDIHAAASFGMAERVAEGLDGDATLVNATRPMGDYAPLHAAAECGHVDVVRLLLERGADVNQRNAWGFRPLHLSVLAARGFAPTEAHLEITRALITQGAEVAVVDDYDRSALTLAEGHWEKGPIEEALIALLREQGATTV